MALPHPGAAVPLDQPLYGATFRQAVGRLFRKYGTLTGRASRSELWWSLLFTNVVMLLSVVPLLVTLGGQLVATFRSTVVEPSATMPMEVVGWLLGSVVAMLPVLVLSLGLTVPTLAVGVRRLHDAGLSGWFVLLTLVSSGVFTIVMGFLPSKVEGLQHERLGSVPLLAPGLVAPFPGFAPGRAGPQQTAPYGVVGQPFAVAPSGQQR